MLNHDQLQAYLAAANAARGLAERCYLQATPKTIAMTRLLSTTTPHLADAVVELVAEVERLQEVVSDYKRREDRGYLVREGR